MDTSTSQLSQAVTPNIQPPVAQKSDSIQSMPKSSPGKGVIILLVALILLILFVLGEVSYLVLINHRATSQKNTTVTATPFSAPKVTTSWQTFSNDKFTIKYPPDWEESLLPDSSIKFTPKGQQHPALLVSNLPSNEVATCNSESQVTIDGVDSIKCPVVDNVIHKRQTIIERINNNNNFVFNFSYYSEEANPYYDALNSAILSSFKAK